MYSKSTIFAAFSKCNNLVIFILAYAIFPYMETPAVAYSAILLHCILGKNIDIFRNLLFIKLPN